VIHLYLSSVPPFFYNFSPLEIEPIFMCRDVSVAVAANADSESPVRKAGSSGEINSNGKCTEF